MNKDETTDPEIQSGLWIFDGIPEEITKILGISPTHTFHKGEPVSMSPEGVPLGRRKENIWRLESPLKKEASFEEHLLWILETVRPKS